jgi:signal transduction histidine kinase
MENLKMKTRIPGILFCFTVACVFLLLPFLAAAETMEELENQLKAASTPSEKLEYLIALVEIGMQAAPQKAREYGNRALQILEDFPDDNIKARVLLGICGASCLLGEYREALDMGKRAEILAGKIGDKRVLAAALGYITNIYLYFSEYHKALDYALKSKKMSEELGYQSGIASALVSIARIHRNLKEYEKALSHYEQALEISEALGNNRYVARILSNIATVYWDTNQYRKALDFYSRGLEMLREMGSEMEIPQVMHNMACVYYDIGKYTQALQYDKESLTFSEKTGNKGQVAFALGSIGRDYAKLKRYKEALAYLGESLNLATQLERRDIIKALYEAYAQVYVDMGDYQNALHYHKKFKEISDEILDEDRNRRIAHLEVVYDVEKKEKENQLLKKNNHIQKLQLERQKLLRNFLALVSVLVVMIAVVTYNRYLIRKKAEQVLRVSEQKLKKMNDAKDRLFTIIAHDLGSPLNSLLLSAGHLKSHYRSLAEQDLQEFIHNIYKQTRDMSDLLENLLQWAMLQIGKIEQNSETVDIRLMTKETVEQIRYTAQKKKIHLISHIAENTTAWVDKHMVKAVLRNLLSNAIKYSYAGGEVKISSKQSGDRIEITVSDDGVGMNPEKVEHLFTEEIHESTRGTSNEKGTGLGLVLCKEFVEKNGGEIWVESRPDQGSRFSFTIPRGQVSLP